MNYKVGISDFDENSTKEMIEICMKIYQKHREAKDFQAIANEIVQATMDLPPFSSLDGIQQCFVGNENIKRTTHFVVHSWLSFKIPNDVVDVRLYKILGNFPQGMPTDLKIQQHVKNLSFDCIQILDSLKNNFGGFWSTIEVNNNESPREKNWAISNFSNDRRQIFEVNMKNNEFITIIHYIRSELVGISANQLSTNKESIPRMIEQICQKFYNSGDFNKIANEILERVSKMEPFVNSTNPIRCLLCTCFCVRNLNGTYLTISLGNFNLILYQDFGATEMSYDRNVTTAKEMSYDRNVARTFLQQLADKYNPLTSAEKSIQIPLEEKFGWHWNCAIIYEKHLHHSTIATRPQNLPMIEALGPNGEWIYAWATRNEAIANYA